MSPNSSSVSLFPWSFSFPELPPSAHVLVIHSVVQAKARGIFWFLSMLSSIPTTFNSSANCQLLHSMLRAVHLPPLLPASASQATVASPLGDCTASWLLLLLSLHHAFSVKGQIVNIWEVKKKKNVVGHIVSVTTTQYCLSSTKADIDDTQTTRHGCAPIKLYLQNHAGFGLWVTVLIRYT